MTAAPPLGELLDALRAEGLAIGVDDHVRVGRLLALDAAWDEAQLRTALAALLAKDRRERAVFDEVWARVFAPTRPEPPPPPAERAAPPPPTPARRGRLVAAAMVATAAVVGLVQWRGRDAGPDATAVREPNPVDEEEDVVPAARDAAVTDVPRGATRSAIAPRPAPPGVPTPVPARAAGGRGSSSAPGEELASTAISTPAPVDSDREIAPSDRVRTVPAPPAPPAIDRVEQTELLGPVFAFAGGGALLAALAGWLALRRQRGRFIPGPWRYALRVPAPTRALLHSEDVEDGAARLTWQADQDQRSELDVERSALATAAHGGLPILAFRAPPKSPRYIVLEDHGTGTESWRGLYDELLRSLTRAGIDLERYSFLDDPSRCTRLDGRRDATLDDLVEHGDCMIVIGSGEAAFDPLEDRAADWLHTLRQMPRRLWINPLPVARWSRGARLIARDTPMEHGVARALALIDTSVDRREPPPTPFPVVADRAPASPMGFTALAAHLGPNGMRMVAALAITGEPAISTVRWLAQLMELRVDEALWLRIAALPWMRAGRWPDGLQLHLASWLREADPATAASIAAHAARALAASEPSTGSAAHLRWQLDVAAARLRVGDDRGAGAAARNVGSTALHREAGRVLTGSGPVGRPERVLRAVAVLGAALLALGIARTTRPVAEVAELAPRRAITVRGEQTGMHRLVLDRVVTEPIDASTVRVHAYVKAFSLVGGGAALDLSRGDWHLVSHGVTRTVTVRGIDRSHRGLVVGFVVERGLLDPERLDAMFRRLRRRGIRAGVVAFCDGPSQFRWLSQFPVLDDCRDAKPTALLTALEEALPAVANADTPGVAGAPERKLVVISSGILDNEEHVIDLGLRAEALNVRIDTIAYSPASARRPLLALAELSNRSEGVFRWLRRLGSDSEYPIFESLISELGEQIELSADFARDELPRSVTATLHLDGERLVSRRALVPWPSCGDQLCDRASTCFEDRCAVSPAPALGSVRWTIQLAAAMVAALAGLELLLVGFAGSRRRRVVRIVVAVAAAGVVILCTLMPSEPNPIEVSDSGSASETTGPPAGESGSGPAMNDLEVALSVHPSPDGRAPTIEATIDGGAMVPADQLTLTEVGVATLRATRTRSFAEAGKPIALAIVLNGQELWIGNDDDEPSDAPSQHPGVLHSLAAALDSTPFDAAHGSLGTVIATGRQPNVKVPMGPLVEITGHSLGVQADYRGTNQNDAVESIELALSALEDVAVSHKVLIVLGTGGDTDPRVSANRIFAAKKRAARDRIKIYSLIYRTEASADETPIAGLTRNEYVVNSAGRLGTTWHSIIDDITGRYVATFPGYDPALGRGFSWDARPHWFVVTANRTNRTGSDPILLATTPVWEPALRRTGGWRVAASTAAVLAVAAIALLVRRRRRR